MTRHNGSSDFSLSSWAAIGLSSAWCLGSTALAFYYWKQSSNYFDDHHTDNNNNNNNNQDDPTILMRSRRKESTRQERMDQQSNKNTHMILGSSVSQQWGWLAVGLFSGLSPLLWYKDLESTPTTQHVNSHVPSESVFMVYRWLHWSSGLVAVWVASRMQQSSPSESASPSYQQAVAGKDTMLWTLLYVTLFPIPASSKELKTSGSTLRQDLPSVVTPWMLVAVLGIQQLWQENREPQSAKRGDSNGGEHVDHESSTDRTVDSNADVAPKEQVTRGRSEKDFELPPTISRTEQSKTLGSNLNMYSAKPKVGETTEPTATTNSLPNKLQNKRYLEILVHNVSHTDLVLSMDAASSQSSNPTSDDAARKEATAASEAAASEAIESSEEKETNNFCLCRPRFSFFDHFCQSIMNNLTREETIVSFFRYQRSVEHPRYDMMQGPANTSPIPTGLSLNSTRSRVMADLSQVRVRGRDHAKVYPNGEVFHHPCKGENGDEAPLTCQFPLNYVFFPLLATLLPRWETQIVDKQYRWASVKRVLILVSGVGTPRNWTHTVEGNSTRSCADLMENFVKRFDPGITVVKIHSSTNIFKYDENLLFVQQELKPVINAYRDAHARGIPYPDEAASDTPLHDFDVDWHKSLAVTISFADGSPARTFAIQAGLRSFRPAFFHFWQLKSFWHENKIVDDDLDVYSFEAMDTSPAIDIHDLTDSQLQLVVEEMTNFKDEMIASLQNSSNDVKKFWLRKSQKPVLAVLLVQNNDGDGKPILYRGTNMEVSMPTGSLCAERNVIGSALAANPNLRREHLKMIAVLAVPLPSSEEQITVSGASNPSSAVGDDQNSITFLKRVGSTASFGTTLAGSYTDLNQFNDRKTSLGSEADERAVTNRGYSFSENASSAVAEDGRDAPLKTISLYPPFQTNSKPSQSASQEVTTPAATPSRKNTQAKRRTLVVVQSSRDLNPLKPCGACNEWLKKIAECNPYFQVVTFTDAHCNGVYCTPCQD